METEIRSESCFGVLEQEDYELDYHPLMNAEILRKIFANFTIRDCKTFRLVHTTWHQELQQRWMDETVVKVSLSQQSMDNNVESFDNDNRPNLQLNDCPHKHNYMSMDNFLYQLSSPSPGGLLFDGKPIRNLRTCGQCTSSPIDLGNSAMSKFWNICCPSLKFIYLQCEKFASAEDVRKLLFEMTPNLDKLVLGSITLVDNPTYTEPTYFQPPAFTQLNLTSAIVKLNDQKLPFSWMSFLSHFPNIKKFTLTTFDWESIDIDLTNLLNAFVTIREYMGNGVLNLTHFSLEKNTENFDWTLDDPTATKLCDLGFPLQNINFEWIEVDKNVLAKVIQSHRRTLKTLTIDRFGGFGGRFYHAFPYHVLPDNLKKLTLNGKVFPTWKFLKYTPNLQKLDVQLWGFGYRVEINPCVEFKKGQIPVLVHLTDLRYDTMNDVVSAKAVKFLIKAMPNVTKLELSVDTEGFEQICKGWNLRKWTARCCLVDKDVFVQHITLLSSLSELSVTKTRFGEVAIHQGFLKLRNLHELVARFSPKVSANSLDLLNSRIPKFTRLDWRTL